MSLASSSRHNMEWLPHYWFYVSRIHQSPLDSSQQCDTLIFWRQHVVFSYYIMLMISWMLLIIFMFSMKIMHLWWEPTGDSPQTVSAGEVFRCTTSPNNKSIQFEGQSTISYETIHMLPRGHCPSLYLMCLTQEYVTYESHEWAANHYRKL